MQPIESQRKKMDVALAFNALTDQIKSLDIFMQTPLLAMFGLFYFCLITSQNAGWNVMLYWLEDKYGMTSTGTTL